MAFADARHGWAVGYSGTILRTVDAGVHWMPQYSPAAADLEAIDFVDAAGGWVVGTGGAILTPAD